MWRIEDEEWRWREEGGRGKSNSYKKLRITEEEQSGGVVDEKKPRMRSEY